MANGLEIILGDPQVKSVFVNVFGGITACDAVANGIVQALALLEQRGDAVDQAARRAPRRQQRRGGPAHPRRRRRTRSSSWSTRWTAPRRRGGRARRSAGGTETMAIFLTEDSKVIVQGMTGSEGTKHTARMLASGTQVVGGVNPRKAGQTVDFDGTRRSRCSRTVAEAMEETGADVSVVFVPPAVHQGRGGRGDRRRDPARRRDHRGRAGARHRRVLRVRRRPAARPGIIGPNCPGLISPGKSNAGIIPADITEAGRIGLV